MNKETDQFNRREFLKVAGYFLTGALYGSSAALLKNLITTDSPYEDLSPGESLQATAVAVNEKDLDNSFVPEEEFSQEVFHKIRSGTYICDLCSDDGIASVTAWCVRNEGNFLYFATSTHGMYDNQNSKPNRLVFWRPNIDDKRISTENFKMVYDKKRDITLIKSEFPIQDLENRKPLDFQDNYRLKADQKVAMVGYPKEFRDYNEDEDNAITLGSVITIKNVSHYFLSKWYASGVTNFGASGSPIAVVGKNESPIIVGMVTGAVFGKRPYFNKEDLLSFKKVYRITGSELAINELMTQVDR